MDVERIDLAGSSHGEEDGDDDDYRPTPAKSRVAAATPPTGASGTDGEPPVPVPKRLKSTSSTAKKTLPGSFNAMGRTPSKQCAFKKTCVMGDISGQGLELFECTPMSFGSSDLQCAHKVHHICCINAAAGSGFEPDLGMYFCPQHAEDAYQFANKTPAE